MIKIYASLQLYDSSFTKESYRFSIKDKDVFLMNVLYNFKIHSSFKVNSDGVIHLLRYYCSQMEQLKDASRNSKLFLSIH